MRRPDGRWRWTQANAESNQCSWPHFVTFFYRRRRRRVGNHPSLTAATTSLTMMMIPYGTEREPASTLPIQRQSGIRSTENGSLVVRMPYLRVVYIVHALPGPVPNPVLFRFCWRTVPAGLVANDCLKNRSFRGLMSEKRDQKDTKKRPYKNQENKTKPNRNQEI